MALLLTGRLRWLVRVDGVAVVLCPARHAIDAALYTSMAWRTRRARWMLTSDERRRRRHGRRGRRGIDSG